MRAVAARLAPTVRKAALAGGAILVDLDLLGQAHDACSAAPWTDGWWNLTGAPFHPTRFGAQESAALIAAALGQSPMIALSRLIDSDLIAIGNGHRVRYRKLPPDLSDHVDTWDDSFRDWGAQAVGLRPDGFYDLTRWSDDAAGRIIVKPAGQRFKGKLIVLIDAANSSATFQFAQVVKDNRLGTLVGETTGGNRRGINGGAFLFLRLPASGIEVDIPLVGYFPTTFPPDAGIVPDIDVRENQNDIAQGRDAVMRHVLA